MFKLKENEFIDWFRISVDIRNHGISLAALHKMSGIPPSTLQDYRARRHRPKLEEAVILLHLWADITGKSIDDDVPTYNPYISDHLQADK
jgi:lambda repressor-like predicted transcriptional regulator